MAITLAYAVAHYFSLLVFEGQRLLALASDPVNSGWNLFGTADWTVDYAAVSPTTIAWVQVGAIVVGHLAGVVLAHDRAVALFHGKTATRSQLPLLAAMVALHHRRPDPPARRRLSVLDTTTVVAHAGEEALYVVVPLILLFVGWRVWDRLRGGPPAEPDDTDRDDI